MSDTVQPITTDRTPEEAVEQIIALMEGQKKDPERPEMPQRGFLSAAKGKHFSCSPRQPDPRAKTLSETLHTSSKSKTTPKPLTRGTAKVVTSTPQQAKATHPARTAIIQQSRKTIAPLRSLVHAPPPGPRPSVSAKAAAPFPPPSKAPIEQPINRTEEGHKSHKNKQKEFQKPEDRKEGVIEPQTQQREIKDPADKKRAIEAVEASGSGLEEIEAFANETSPLSELAGERITQRDILSLFFEILKLFQNSKELQKEARRVLRKEQLMHIDAVIEQYNAQGSALLNAAFRGSAFSILGGLAPLAGPLAGDWFFEQLASWTGRFKNLSEAQRSEWYTWIAKGSQSLAEGQTQWGQAEVRISDGGRSLNETLGQLCRSDEEECSRIIQEYLEQWRRISEFLDQHLRMQHDTATRL